MVHLLARAAAFGLLPALVAFSAVARAADFPGPAVGQPAPAFSLTTVDGRTVRLADYRGRTLVINVWGSWCPPCRLETPDLIAEAKADAARGVAFLGIDTTESASVVRAFAATKGVPYPQIAVAPDSAFAQAYHITNFPTTFVIDPSGVLRAVHADNVLPRVQLHAYIVAARRGESAPLTSPFQASLDALLDPAAYSFDGDAAAVRANVRRAAQAIAKADDLLDDAMDDPSRDHDLLATQREEERLRAPAIAALARVAGADDVVLLDRLRGDEAAYLGEWRSADTYYGDALRLVPDDEAALAGAAFAAAQLGDYARAAAFDERLAKLRPSAPAFVALGRAQAKAGRIDAAEAAFARARMLAAANPARAAWTALYEARMEAEARNPDKAAAAYGRAASAAARIPRTDPRSAWYAEQAQEGEVALALAPGATARLSLAPWTGPDLPGSIASTFKYRLVVAGMPGARITLVAAGLPPRWIGSFCTDRVCAPFRTSVVVPAIGVKVVEFQVVPTTHVAGSVAVRVDARAGSRHIASAVATLRG
ncbi:MAG: TlpA family protein disulfide reductase [Candidatus Eremiobacteraeota bacterium]|nr:TlpA family protein disulfide reductase [Candidatus Eremiobacteraeota bacterium]